MPPQREQQPTINKMAITSLGLNFVSLAIYMMVVANPSVIVFLTATGGAFITGLIGLGLSLTAKKQASGNFLTTINLVLSVGYIFCIGIIIFGLVIYWI